MTPASLFARGLLAVTLSAAVALADAPTIDPADDPAHFGPVDQMMFWDLRQKISGFRNFERLFQTRPIEAGGSAYPLPDSRLDFSGLRFEFLSETYDLDGYIRRSNTAGIIVIKDGSVALERYALGNTEDSRWISFSVAKSVVSMLLGAAIKDGYIDNVDEKVTAYLPRLKNSSYDDVSIRNVLQMASGVAWNEDYADPKSDVNTYPWYDVIALFDFLGDKEHVAAPGDKFTYNSAETELVGSLVRAAIGNNLSTYLAEKIWQPLGMESNANWLLGVPGGGEIGGCCISATLRDYGRLGLFALHNGRLADGTEVLPDGWMRQSTSASAAFDGYGYLWWLNSDGTYEARGVFGQIIHINPQQNIVIAKHAAWADASTVRDHQFDAAFLRAVARLISEGTDSTR